MKKITFFTIVSLLIGIQSISLAYTKVNHLEDAYAESQNTKQKIVVVLGAEWCKFCKQLNNDLEKEKDSLSDYIYVYVDIDQRPDLKKEYSVKNIPDSMILENSIETKRKVGYKGIKDFLQWVEKK